jgi:hypothetical protein
LNKDKNVVPMPEFARHISNPEIWNLPYDHSASFVGREDEMQIVITALEQDGIATIGGEGGENAMGKTRLATELAWQQRGNYAGVVWIDGVKGVQESCAKIIDDEVLPGQDPIAEINNVIEARGGRSLWILDDVREIPAELSVPHPNRHVVLASADIQQPTVTLGPLSVVQGAEAVLRRGGQLRYTQQIESVAPEALQHAKIISEAVGNIPKLLEGAGRYLNDTRCGVTRLAHLITDPRYHESVMRELKRE